MLTKNVCDLNELTELKFSLGLNMVHHETKSQSKRSDQYSKNSKTCVLSLIGIFQKSSINRCSSSDANLLNFVLSLFFVNNQKG